jgi:hypothetical protein
LIQKKKKSLKGRVNFSHFKAIKNIEVLPARTEILGTPRASYYPIYVKQNGELFTTFMDSDFSIVGRKRYPIHNTNKVQQTEDTGNSNVGVKFRPLKEGVVFRGKLRYHNLKKAELGAILSALTFHDTPNTYHNIGLAKSLGYGKLDIKIDGINNIKEYLKEFEVNVTLQILDWKDSLQIKELLSMAVEQNNSGNSKLKYMQLEQFAKHKTEANKDYLRPYSELQNIKTININSLVSDSDLKELKEKQKAYEEQQRRLLEQKQQKEKMANDIQNIEKELEKLPKEVNIQIVENFINKYPDYEKLDEVKTKLQNIKDILIQDKHSEVNSKFDSALEALQSKKGKPKQYQKEFDKFIKKWSAGKNNKGSEYIIEKLKEIKK